jgi:hypothetical protein
MADKLTTALNEKGKAQQYLFNLEKLKEEGSVENIHYEALKKEYTRMLQEAQSIINEEKSQVQKILDKQKQELAVMKLDLKYLEIRYKVGEISIDTFTKKEAQPRKKIEELEKNIAQMEQVINAPEVPSDIVATVQNEPKKSSKFSFSFGKKKEDTPVTINPPLVAQPVNQNPAVEKPIEKKPVEEKPVNPSVVPEEQVNVSQPQPAVPPENTSVEDPPVQKEIPLPAGLIITNLDILPNRVAAGNHVGIVAGLKNNSDNPIQHRIELKINGEVKDYRDIFLAPGGTEEITFMTLTNRDGEYTVDIGGQIGHYTVMYSR